MGRRRGRGRAICRDALEVTPLPEVGKGRGSIVAIGREEDVPGIPKGMEEEVRIALKKIEKDSAQKRIERERRCKASEGSRYVELIDAGERKREMERRTMEAWQVEIAEKKERCTKNMEEMEEELKRLRIKIAGEEESRSDIIRQEVRQMLREGLDREKEEQKVEKWTETVKEGEEEQDGRGPRLARMRMRLMMEREDHQKKARERQEEEGKQEEWWKAMDRGRKEPCANQGSMGEEKVDMGVKEEKERIVVGSVRRKEKRPVRLAHDAARFVRRGEPAPWDGILIPYCHVGQCGDQ